MAVEANRIKGRLKELYPKANLSTKRIDEISARLAQKADDGSDDTAIDLLVKNANDFFPFEEIAKQDDRMRAFEAKSKEKPQDPTPTDEKKPTVENPTPTTDDAPNWAKALADTNKILLQKISDLEKGKITETKKENAKRLFDKNETFKSLSEKSKEFLFNQIDVDSETPIEDQLTEVEAQYNGLVQHKADSTNYSSAPPTGKGNPSEPTDDEVKAALAQL